ncbi:MAG TPA: GNAT family N-acetyltransferase [Brevundimonas sp.]|jgi:ribosomal protein S18 acetylase RimI-like enzyme|uniref:GNAT family N-acetyltransferase n=1 Tax=Brevundimonas sp. TaxID=1871086 RepID=UPI002EDA6715
MELHGRPAEHPLSELSGDGLNWRPMTEADLDGVVAVAAEAFPHHFEDRACFAERLALFPQGCRVLGYDTGSVQGYLFAYPWRADAAPPLNALVGVLPQDPGVLYLHDLALSRTARGGGHAGSAVEDVMELARAGGWPAVSLVAVNDAAAFWARHGFEVADPPGMQEKLASYGPDARYMVRRL